MRFFPAVLAAVTLVTCAPRVSYYPQINYQNSEFDGGYFSGRTIVVLPLLTSQGASAALPCSLLGALAFNRYPDARIECNTAFERRISATLGHGALNRFYRLLYADSVLTLQVWDSLWAAVDADLVLSARLRNGKKIRSFAGKVKRTIRLDTEIWNVNSAEVVWHAYVTAFTFDTTHSDAKLVLETAEQALKLLPPFRPGSKEKQW